VRLEALDLLKVDTHSRSSHGLVSTYLEVFNLYMDRVYEQAILTRNKYSSNQTKGAVALLDDKILMPFRELVDLYLNTALLLPVDNNTRFVDNLLRELISCWARFAALMTDTRQEVGDPLVGIAYMMSYSC
jgi:hypothetical protein